MKKIFIIYIVLIVLITLTAKADGLNNFFVRFDNCIEENFKFKETDVKPIAQMRMECSNIESLMFCSISEKRSFRQAMFFEKKSSNPKVLKFGSKKRTEEIIIKDREVFFYNQNEDDDSINFNKCVGVLYRNEDVDKIKMIDLNFGLQEIVKALDEEGEKKNE